MASVPSKSLSTTFFSTDRCYTLKLLIVKQIFQRFLVGVHGNRLLQVGSSRSEKIFKPLVLAAQDAVVAFTDGTEKNAQLFNCEWEIFHIKTWIIPTC